MDRPKGSALKPSVDIRRAGDRFLTRNQWLESYHSFSFSRHYDPENTRHGLLLVSNDDVIQPGTGFLTHPHRDMEIITWVLDGELEHKDTLDNRGIIYPGLAQRMSAGTGIWHSEMNPSGRRPVHLVQMWVLPDTESISPGYEQVDINPQLSRGDLVPIASGKGHQAAISIRQRGAVLWGGRLLPAQEARLPDAPFVHLYVAKGAVSLEGEGWLAQGDAARLTAAGGRRITADAQKGAEVLIWEMGS